MNHLLTGALLLAASVVPCIAQVTINHARVDVASTALTGRLGSVMGPITDDPAAIQGTTGLVTLASDASAGPIQPGDIPSLPGTTGVVNNRSRATVVLSNAGAARVIQSACFTGTSMYNLDGGTHQGFGDASFEVSFTLTATTPYTISGNFLPDDQTNTFIRIENSPFFYFGPVGAFSGSGTLGPGTYRLQAGVTVYEATSSGPTFDEYGLITARLVLGSSTLDCRADLGQEGGAPGGDGILDNNDFVVFIDYFFSQNPLGDFGSEGGSPVADGLFDNNDFVVFIDAFFQGC
jgi:hypothetical protein